MNDVAAVRLVAQDQEGCVCCADSGQHKLLGRLTARGVHLWCKICRREHTVTWDELLWLRCRLLAAEEKSGAVLDAALTLR